MVNEKRLTNNQTQPATANPLQFDADRVKLVLGNPAHRLGLKPAPKMKQVVEALTKKHGLILYQDYPYLKLELSGYMPLCIENPTGRVFMAHYFEQNGDLVPDPDMEFYLDEENMWYPFSITQSFFGYKRYVEFGEDGNPSKLLNAAMQADLARFATMWASNITDQGWLEHGVAARSVQDA